jgi:NAD(P)-dependent dehydrogenase (short-subunit alcohol dehydrogenase family)
VYNWYRFDQVNNAGVQYIEETIDDVTPDQLDKVMRTNVYSCFYLSKAAMKHFKEHSGCTVTQV